MEDKITITAVEAVTCPKCNVSKSAHESDRFGRRETCNMCGGPVERIKGVWFDDPFRLDMFRKHFSASDRERVIAFLGTEELVFSGAVNGCAIFPKGTRDCLTRMFWRPSQTPV
jgi:NAD-dependent SIR2 family protein deacetylase